MAYFIDEAGKRGLKAEGKQFFAWDFGKRKFVLPVDDAPPKSRMERCSEFEAIPAWDDVRDWPGKVVGCCDYEGNLSAPVGESADGTEDLSAPVAENGDGTEDLSAPVAENGDGTEDLSAPVAENGDGTVMWDEGYGCWWKLSEIVAFDRPIPSGNTTPSVQDRELTAALKQQGEALGVTVLDHLVIGGDSFSAV